MTISLGTMDNCGAGGKAGKEQERAAILTVFIFQETTVRIESLVP